MRENLQKHTDKLRFGLVGIFNTALDFGILFLLVFLGLDKIPSNYISTTIAFLCSFALNRNYTFHSKSAARKQFIPFVVVTLAGLWVLQPLVIWLVAPLLATMFNSALSLFGAKVFATMITMVWNYVLYKRFVFKD